MNSLARTRRRILCAVLAVTIVALLPACGILDEGTPKTARVVITGPAGHPLRLVTTSDFDAVSSADGDSREVTVFSADTAAVSVPFDRTYGLGPRTRIYVVVGSDSTAAAAVRVQVFIDNEIRFERSTRFADREDLVFVFASAGGNR